MTHGFGKVACGCVLNVTLLVGTRRIIFEYREEWCEVFGIQGDIVLV